MNQVAEYIKYRWKAKKRHGIHSPFVYEMSDKALSAKWRPSDINTIKRIKTGYSKNGSIIEIRDLGIGSKKLGSHRSIKSIYSVSSSRSKYSNLLYLISEYYKPKNILELGTSLGIGSIALSLGNPKSKITTIEGCPETAKIALDTFHSNELSNINCEILSFDEKIDRLTTEIFDLIYIDGHHDDLALLSYIERLIPYSTELTIWIVDDIRWSDSMFDAWQKLISDDRFHVSIDFFRMGVLLRKSEQRKEHFVLRF